MRDEQTLGVYHPAMFRNQPVLFLLVLILCFFAVGIPIMLIWWLTCLCTTLTITTNRSTLRRGLLSKSITEVWHRDVRNVQLSQSLLQRIFGVGEIGISSAGQGGVELQVAGIPGPARVKRAIDEYR